MKPVGTSICAQRDGLAPTSSVTAATRWAHSIAATFAAGTTGVDSVGERSVTRALRPPRNQVRKDRDQQAKDQVAEDYFNGDNACAED